MPHPQELEAIPTAGTLVGRHLIVREIAKGTIGPLYLARTQNTDDTVDTLARVIPLPADLPARDDQLIAEAIWDSANVGHDMVLRVADVVAGKGWVTLVHDYHLGSLVGSMHRRSRDLGSAFPSEIAARVALDVLEGLEQSRSLCETNQIPWRPGSISISSLYLCSDGRTRALDGQVMAAVLRSAQMRMVSGTADSVAPELLDDSREPDERTDVFAVGAVLWELLTGREILVDRNAPIANVILSVPKGVQVPQGLVHALHRAIEIEPEKRQASLRELAVALVMGAEKVATYEQVLEFASTLLPYEPAFQAAIPEPQPEPDLQRTEASSPQARHETPELGMSTEPAVSQRAGTHGLAEPSAPRFASPFAPASSAPRIPVSGPADTTGHSPAPTPDVQPATPNLAAGSFAAGVADALGDAPARAASEALPSGAAQTTSTSNGFDVSVTVSPSGVEAVEGGNTAKSGRLEQISWPDDEDAPLPAAKASATAVDSSKKSNGAKPNSSAANDPLQIVQDPPAAALHASAALEQPGKAKAVSQPIEGKQEAVAAKPAVEHSREARASGAAVPASGKSIRRDSGRPVTTKSPKSTASSPAPGKSSSVRPKTTRSTDAALSNVASAAQPDDDLDASAKPAKSGLQISMTTLILALSTTVLTVVLIMILVQRKSSPPPSATVPAAQAEQPAPERAVPNAPGESEATEGDRNPDERASSVSAKTPETKPTTPADTKVERQKRPTKSGGYAPSRQASANDDKSSDDAKAPKKPKNYVPSDL